MHNRWILWGSRVPYAYGDEKPIVFGIIEDFPQSAGFPGRYKSPYINWRIYSSLDSSTLVWNTKYDWFTSIVVAGIIIRRMKARDASRNSG